MKLRTIVERAEAPRTLGGFPVTVVNVEQSSVKEFALPGGDDREPDEEHILKQLAAQWWNGTEQQMARAQKTLAAMGWEIGQDESGDDDAGVFVIRAGDENGDTYMAFPHSELALDETSPMIKPPTNRFDSKQEAFAHAREHGGRVFRREYIDPNTGEKRISFVVKNEQDMAEQEDKMDSRFKKLEWMPLLDAIKILKHYGATPEKYMGHDMFPYYDREGNRKYLDDISWNADNSKNVRVSLVNAAVRELKAQQQGVAEQIQRLNHDLDEAIKLNAPQEIIPRDQLQGYADRIKTGTKTKRDKFAPIIHGSNIKAITKDNGGTEWDLDDLAKQITTRPRAILGTNAKMEKSKTEGEIIYDLTLPALSGIVVDEESGDFVEIKTCPGAGECQLFCYARKGGYVMFPASSMSAAQALNFLVNEPEGYMAAVNKEITALKSKTDKAGIQLVVRWHDAGDFFSKEYLDLAYDVANANPDVKFYAYTKMGDVATGSHPPNFIINFSSGSKSREVKKVELHRQAGNTVKQGVTVPKNMFFDLIARKGNSLIKDAKGRTQFASPEALDTFKDRLAQQYRVPRDTIITYDQMLSTPEGPKPRWNVIVQPGAGDRAANRLDVIDSYLMFH